MNVLVTGATGYVGHQLALALANANYIVHAIVRDVNSSKVPVHKNIRVFKGDICDFNSVFLAMEGCKYVFHTAAYTNLKSKNIGNFYNCNVLGTETVLKAAWQSQVKKVIYTSTLSVFGPSYKEVPITESQPRIVSYGNDYELTKSMSEEVVLDYTKKGMPCVILNLTRVYGPGLNTFSNGVNRLVTLISKKNVLVVPSKLKVVSNYVYIDDVVNAHLLAINKGISGEKYIIGGENMDYSALFLNIKSLTKSKIKILKINYKLLKGFIVLNSILNWLLGFNSSITAKMFDSLFTNRCASSQKAIANLNYKITPFNIGLNHTINFLSK